MVRDLDLLLFFADFGLYQKCRVSTIEIALRLGVSQQTVSRKLMELEKEKLISRTHKHRGIEISLTEKAITQLKEHFLNLKNVFEKQPKRVEGFVSNGVGEGAYYIQKYNSFLKKKLGFKAFPGTLNLKVDEIKVKNFLNQLNPVYIKEFKATNRTFGGITCYKVKINSVKGAIVVPDRTRYSANVLELIAPLSLRKKFDLNEGSKINVSTIK